MGTQEKNGKNRKKLHEVSLEQDIRYRGPLSYRHFKILGWICIALSQVVVILNLMLRVMPEASASVTILAGILPAFSQLSVPFFLFANFSTILDNRNGYKKQILINGAASGAIVLAFLFVYYHYIVGVVSAYAGGRTEGVRLAQELFASDGSGVFSFNLFIDLFLCTMFMFFLNYEPVRYFTGKKLIWFRLLAILPLAYEAGSLLLKYLASREQIVLPPVIYPLLTTKPVMMFLVFIVLALFIKRRERRFLKHGRTKKEYQIFLSTNRNSFHFSVFAAILFVIAGIVDFLMLTVFVLHNITPEVAEQAIVDSSVLTQATLAGMGLGIGTSIALIPMAPILLLFSYNKRHKNSFVDLLVPIGGVALIVLIYLEAIYRAIALVPGLLGM